MFILRTPLDKVERWLKNMNLKILSKDKEHSMLTLVFLIAGKTFLVRVIVGETWINILALVGLVKELSPTEQRNLYRACLTANYMMPEVTFSADREGDVYVEADMPTDTTEDNFKIEFQSVVFGIKYFMEQIAPKINYEVKDTIVV
jgi:hypothetical protein